MENGIDKTMKEKVSKAIIHLNEFPKYNLFLSQVIEFLEDTLNDEIYTKNIIQNYIKNDVISRPLDGKKKGYTKLHLIQLIFVSYMRPVLSTDEIQEVFRLAFNDINNRDDDIISWKDAYNIFYEIQNDQIKNKDLNMVIDDIKLKKIISDLKVKHEEEERIYRFITVLSLVAKASFIKSTAKDIISLNKDFAD